MIRLTINEREFESNGHETILKLARRVGIDIPTLCFDSRVDPIGSCRLCCVEVEGQIHPQIGWRALVDNGM